MANKLKFELGDWVIIKKEVIFKCFEGRYRSFRKEKTGNQLARITEITTKQTEYIDSYDAGVDDDYFDSKSVYYLTNVKTHKVWCFKTGMMNRERYAFEEDIIVAQWWGHFPIKESIKRLWSEKDKKLLRAEMVNIPRNSKGSQNEGLGTFYHIYHI